MVTKMYSDGHHISQGFSYNEFCLFSINISNGLALCKLPTLTEVAIVYVDTLQSYHDNC